jgi:diketogulonate reductase-like aldo/keto reductase
MPAQLDRLLAETFVVPAVNQIEVHPYFQQAELQRLHAEHGIVTQAWSPIGGITSYRPAEKNAFEDSTLLEIGRQHGKSAAQVMLRWHLQAGRIRVPRAKALRHHGFSATPLERTGRSRCCDPRPSDRCDDRQTAL